MARTQCERNMIIRNSTSVTVVGVSALVTACNPALSSPAVAEDFCFIVVEMLRDISAEANRVTCAAAGVIPAVVTAMSALCDSRSAPRVAARGCTALGWLTVGNRANADAIALSAGGVDAVRAAMASHPGVEAVQHAACWALRCIACAASGPVVASMRTSAVVKLLHTAMLNHPGKEVYTVRYWAEDALAVLTREY